MPSKEVTDREKSSRAVVATGEAHAKKAADALAARFEPLLEPGEKLPDVALFVRLLGRHLATTTKAMVAADRAHESELADDAGPRKRRDAAFAALYPLAVECRDQIASVLGDDALGLLAMSDPAPSDPAVLATWTRGVLAKLRDKDLALPAPKRRTASVDRKAVESELRAAVAPLDAALADVDRERREAEATQVAKNDAIDASDAAFSQAANAYAAVFRAAGMNDIAAKVRPSARRPGVTDAQPEPADPAKPT